MVRRNRGSDGFVNTTPGLSPDAASVSADEADLIGYDLEAQPWHSPLPEVKDVQSSDLESFAEEVDVVVMTATLTELSAVLRRLLPLPRKKAVLKGPIEQETYYLGRFGDSTAAVTKCRMGSIGPSSAILATEHALKAWRPRAVVMVGIAFGANANKQRIADVLVATEIISYEPQRVGRTVSFRGQNIPTTPTLLNRFENALDWTFKRPDGTKCNHLNGPILSGEKLVNDVSFKQSLLDHYPQAIGGEMEGVGLGAVSLRNGVPWILVKGICDWADGRKGDKHQPLAAAAAASLAHFVLSQKDIFHGLRKVSSN